MNERIAPPDFVGYEYKELTVKKPYFSFCVDGYQNFGWRVDENVPRRETHGNVAVMLKRDRRLVNRAELTRLQQGFDACVEEIQALQRAKTTLAVLLAVIVGLIGTAFMALSVFAVTDPSPDYRLCALLAVPAFAGWIAPVFLYRWMTHRKTVKLNPLIEAKYEEAYHICARGRHLLPQG